MPFMQKRSVADDALPVHLVRLRNEERVDLIMSFYGALKEFRALASRFEKSDERIRYDDIDQLIETHLRPVKDSCHRLFHESAGAPAEGVLQAIFDMAFGILFHILLKAKENLRLRENYNVARLEELVDNLCRTAQQHDIPVGLSHMFDRLAEEYERDSHELEAEIDRAAFMFDQLESLFHRIIQVYSTNITILRSLYARKEFFAELFPDEGVERLFSRIYPRSGPVEAYLFLGFDFLRSGHPAESEHAFTSALQQLRQHWLPPYRMREIYAYYRERVCAHHRGQPEQALVFEERLKEFEKSPLVHALLGETSVDAQAPRESRSAGAALRP